MTHPAFDELGPEHLSALGIALSVRHQPDPQFDHRLIAESRFGPLLAEGFSARDVIRAIREGGLSTVVSVRAFLEGSPVEWAKAFERREE